MPGASSGEIRGPAREIVERSIERQQRRLEAQGEAADYRQVSIPMEIYTAFSSVEMLRKYLYAKGFVEGGAEIEAATDKVGKVKICRQKILPGEEQDDGE